jgi:hypothetical protein
MPRINVFYILETVLAVRRDRDGVAAAYGVEHGTLESRPPGRPSIGWAALVGFTGTGTMVGRTGIGHPLALTAIRAE